MHQLSQAQPGPLYLVESVDAVAESVRLNLSEDLL